MKFTAIYNTYAIAGVHYSFDAENVDEAIEFSRNKFAEFPKIAILAHEDRNKWSNEGRLVFLNGERITGVDGSGNQI